MSIPRESQVVLGTVVIHAIIIGVMALATELHEDEPDRPAPTLRMVQLDTRRRPPPAPPAAPPAVQPPPTAPSPPTTRRAPPKRVASATTPTTPPVTTVEPPPTTTTPAPGGAPVVTLPGMTPAAHGVAVASGSPTDRRTGRGGSGAGTGLAVGTGAGSGPPAARVASIASIKKMAVPKGDYDYFDAKKQYPAEARQLGVGGVIRVQLTIDVQGQVVKVRLLGKGLGHGLDELALTRAHTLQFEPALDTDDRPVASVLTWTFRFEVPS